MKKDGGMDFEYVYVDNGEDRGDRMEPVKSGYDSLLLTIVVIVVASGIVIVLAAML